MARKPTNNRLCVLAQLCNLIPAYMVPKIANATGAAKKARTFSPWSHVVSMMYCQLAHSMSLNDASDALKTHAPLLHRIREASAPARNTLSHANRKRDASMAEQLFYAILDHLMKQHPQFGTKTFKMPRRFKRTISAVDSSVIRLVANCIDWARHRRRKAAAKLHLRLNIGCFLPAFAIIDTAAHHDNLRARELCAHLQAGEIVVFDKGYLDFEHLLDLTNRLVFWVTRSKTNLQYTVVGSLPLKVGGSILSDEKILLSGPLSSTKHDKPMRLVRAMVEMDGKLCEMSFLTNNFDWAASSIAELYKCRWQIEVFFKEIKQTLHLCDFLGHSRNAVQWQVWTALILYLLLRFVSYANSWKHGFRRLFCLLRACLWDCALIPNLLARCGTAGESPPWHAAAHQLYLPGFLPEQLKD